MIWGLEAPVGRGRADVRSGGWERTPGRSSSRAGWGEEKGVGGAAGGEGSESKRLGPRDVCSHGISVWRGCGECAGNASPSSPFFPLKKKNKKIVFTLGNTAPLGSRVQASKI